MREWCQRDDFRTLLPALLEGEDDAFGGHIRSLAAAETGRAPEDRWLAGGDG